MSLNEFPSQVEDFQDMKVVRLSVDNVLTINVPFNLSDDEEDAFIYAHAVKQLKNLIKADKIQFSLTPELV